MTDLVSYKGAFKKFQSLLPEHESYKTLAGRQPAVFSLEEITIGYVKHDELKEYGFYLNSEADTTPAFHSLAMERPVSTKNREPS